MEQNRRLPVVEIVLHTKPPLLLILPAVRNTIFLTLFSFTKCPLFSDGSRISQTESGTSLQGGAQIYYLANFFLKTA